MSDGKVVNIEAEQAVLGSMLIDADCIERLMPRLREEDFWLETDKEIFRVIQRMHHQGAKIDALTLAEEMRADSERRDYLAQLMEVTPTSANAPEYAEILSETGKRRRLRDALHDAITGIDEQRETADVAADVDLALSAYRDATVKELLSPIDQAKNFLAYRQMVDSGDAAYTRTYYRALDKLLGGGLFNGGLYFLAARPGVGKTALAINIAERVGENAGPVCFLSLEMTNAQLMARRVAGESGVDSKLLLTSKLTEGEYTRVAEAVDKLGSRNVYLTEALMDVKKAASIAQAVKGVRLVIIDHFTLFLRPHKQQDYAEYAEISHALAHLAKRINAPVLCLIQVSRETEQRKGRARLSDLRGSGATEEDATGVLILNREQQPEGETDGDPADKIAPRLERVYLDKNRFGETGSVSMSFWPAVNRFRETYA